MTMEGGKGGKGEEGERVAMVICGRTGGEREESVFMDVACLEWGGERRGKEEEEGGKSSSSSPTTGWGGWEGWV